MSSARTSGENLRLAEELAPVQVAVPTVLALPGDARRQARRHRRKPEACATGS